MTPASRERLCARIRSGAVRIKTSSGVVCCKPPTPDEVCASYEAYDAALVEAQAAELFSEPEMLALMTSRGEWSRDDEARLVALPNLITDKKIELYENCFRSETREKIRSELTKLKIEHNALHARRHSHDHLTAEGFASEAKGRHLVGCSVGSHEPHFVEECQRLLLQSRPTEAEYRDLARNDPWRGIWSCREVEGLFGVPAAKMSDEQLSLLNSSIMYENIRQHPKCPPDEVVDDDDMLDGWMALQRREQEKATPNDSALLNASEKVMSSQEVFLVGETANDAKRIMEMNDAGAKRVITKRFAKVAEHGELAEQELPDMKARIRSEAMALENAHIRGDI